MGEGLKRARAAARATQKPTTKRITAKHFKAATGYKPEQDDLERCNYPEAGNLLHQYCGWDWERDKPKFWPADTRTVNAEDQP